MRLRNDFDDLLAMRNVFFGNEYRLLEAAPKGGPDPEKWVIDIGAHIGTFSLLAVMLGYKRIAAFEPELDNYTALNENLAGLRNDKGVETFCRRVAVMPPGVRCAAVVPHKEGRSMMGAVVTDPAGPVDCIGLEYLIGVNFAYGIGIVKVDIEGGEFDLIRTCPPDTLKAPDEWLIECHTPYGDPEEIRRLLFEAGYTVAMYPDPNHKDGNAHLVASRIRVLASTPGVEQPCR